MNLFIKSFSILIIILIQFPSSAQDSLFPYGGLVAGYSFCGNANDISGSNHNGNVIGATPCADRYNDSNNAYNFNGIDNYIMMDTIDFSVPISISLWFKSNNINNVWNTIICWCNHENNPDFEGIQLFTDGNGKLDIRMGTRSTDLKIPTSIDGDAYWHHVVATKDTADNINVYVDTILVLSNQMPASIGNHHLLLIGRSHQLSYNSEYFKGAIDDIMIYNHILTMKDIKYLYNYSGLNKFKLSKQTLALWHFDERSGDTVFDISGHNYNGYLLPGVSWRNGLFGGSIYSSSPISYITIPNIIELETAKQFKIEAIINIPAYSYDVTNPILHIGKANELTITLAVGTHHRKVLCFQTNGPYAGGLDSLEVPLEDSFFGKWNKVAAEYINGIKNLYLNNILVATDTIDSLSFPSEYSTYIGGDTWGANSWCLNGFIDELQILAPKAEQPIIISPEEESEISAIANLIWTSVYSSDDKSYEVQISTLPSFNNTILTQKAIADTSIKICELDSMAQLPLLTHLFWRVRFTSTTDSSAWSPSTSFYLIDHALYTTQQLDTPPSELVLFQNQPNPFNPSTKINFGIPVNKYNNIYLQIYNLEGRQIKCFTGNHSTGYHTITWDGKNENNNACPTGLYICKLTCNDKTKSIKMLLMK